MVVVIMLGKVIKMNREEIDLLESVFTLAIGECAYNDINNIQKLEDKIKTINNLCKKQKEVIDKIYELIKQHIRKDEFLELNEWQTRELLDILKEVSE